MKIRPIIQSLIPAIDAEKLSLALSESAMPCKVVRYERSSVKIYPDHPEPNRIAIKSFTAGFSAGYFAF